MVQELPVAAETPTVAAGHPTAASTDVRDVGMSVLTVGRVEALRIHRVDATGSTKTGRRSQ